MLVWDWYSDNHNIDALVWRDREEGEGEEVHQEEEEGCSRDLGSQDNQKLRNEMEAVSENSSWSQTLHLLQFLKEDFIIFISYKKL